jgi:O-antigen/teichoic acid export membrane protein
VQQQLHIKVFPRDTLPAKFQITSLAEKILPARLAERLHPFLLRAESLFSGDDEQVVLARLMGSFEFGIYVLVWTVTLILGDLACFGFHTTIIRYVPQYLQKNQSDDARGILRTGPVFALISASTITLIAIAVLKILSAEFEPYYWPAFLIGVLCIPAIALGNISDGTARSQGWILSALSPGYVVLLLTGWEARATTALIAAFTGTSLTVIGQQIFLRNRISKVLPKGASQYHLREWIKVSLPIFLIEGFFFLLINIDVLMVGRMMEPDSVALYFAVTKVLALAHFVYFAVKSSVAQRYSQLLHSGDKEAFQNFARNSARWTFWPSLLLGLLLLAGGWPLLALFGREFTQGYPLLFILIFGVIARASVGPCESLLSMSGNQNICALLYALALIVNVGLNLTLIPLLGLSGAAIATVCAMATEAATLSYAVRKYLGITMFVFAPSAKTSG